MYTLAKSVLRHPTRWVRLLFTTGARSGKADVGRWQDLGNFDPAWDERSRLLAGRVSPGQSVIEFGCGRGQLAAALPPGTDYLGSDIVARGPDTLVWDLNHGAPPLKRDYDVAIFSGVLEYVADIPMLIVGLRPRAANIVASYAAIEEVPDRLTRRENGWINDLTADSFVRMVEAAGYRLDWRRAWTDSSLYHFSCNG